MRTLAAIAVVVAASFGAAGSAAAPGADHYTDASGWSIAYPAALHLEHSSAHFRLDWYETTVATFAPVKPIHLHYTRGGMSAGVAPPADARGRFPAAGAALRIFRSEGGPPPDLDVPQTRLPLQLTDLRPAEYSQGPVRPLEQRVAAYGLSYVVDVWFGRRASSATRSAIERTLESFSFPPLRIGETLGHGLVVMHRAAAYPVGSVTRVHIAGDPYFLVHAPGGFYTLGWRWASLSGGYKSRCSVLYRAARHMFACPSIGASWDRIGRVLTRPVGGREGDQLNLSPARVSQDGHVLADPGLAIFAGRRVARRFWPAWRR